MDKLEQIKQKIQEYQNKSAVTQDLKAFLTLVLTYIKTAKEEFNSLSSEQLGTIKEAVDYIETQKKVLLEDVTHETQVKTDEMKSLIAEVKDFLVEVKKIKATPGKDAEPVDYERIIGSVLEQIPMPEMPELPEIEEKTPDELVKDINKSTTLILKDKVEGLLDIERMAKMNAPGGSSTTFVNGKLAKNIYFTNATVTYQGDTASITTTGGGGGTWGSITGTLSDQTDLQTALDAKLDGNGTATYVPYYSDANTLTSEAHFSYNSTTHVLHVHGLSGDATDGLLIESDNGTDIAIMGAANTANVSWYGNHNFGGTLIQPTANDGASLGASLKSWSDLFLAEGAVINFNNGTYTITQSGTSLTFSGSVSLGSNTLTAGDFVVGSSVTLNDGATLDFYSDTGITQVGGILVDSANQYSLFNVTSNLSAILDVSAIATTNKTITIPNRSLTLDNITTSTTTNGTGFLKGNGSVISFDNSTYTPTSTTITVAGTANQITSSAGAQDLSANRTWTLSFPADVLIPTVLTVPNTGLHLLDTNASHDLIIAPGSDLTADHTLTLTTGDADRTITLSGNPTLADWFDQSVKTTASPQFVAIELNHASANTLTASGGHMTIEGATVWDSGNDGSGSGLDADLLDGKNTGTSGNTVPLLDGTNTWSGLQTFSLAGNTARFVNTTDNASVQVAKFEGDRATIANNDEGYVSLILSDSAGNQDEQARITWKATTTTSGATQDGQLIFSTLLNNVLTTALTIGGASIDATFAGNLSIGTSNAFTAGTIELGHATDTTLSRSSAGVLAVEGVVIPTVSSTNTLTNKAITQRVVTTTDDATAVIDVAVTDTYELSAIANNTTFSTTGSPTDGQKLIIRWKDAGVSKTITWDAIFVAVGVTLPTATTAGKWQYVGCQYNSGAAKFHAIAVATQA